MPQRLLLPSSNWATPVQAPPLSVHSKKVQLLIRKLRTPKQVQLWLRTLRYNHKETMYGIEGVVRRGRAHCLEGALCAAALLEYHGYPPIILDLESADLLDHTLFLFQRNGKYGTVGMSRDVGLHGRKPVFRSMLDLVESYALPYIDHRAQLTGYGLLDLQTLSLSRWRTSRNSVWHIEDALREIPHHKLTIPISDIRTWQSQYRRWKHEHPDQQPNYYPHQDRWM